MNEMQSICCEWSWAGVWLGFPVSPSRAVRGGPVCSAPIMLGALCGWVPGPLADCGKPTALPFSLPPAGEGAMYTRCSPQVTDYFFLPWSPEVQRGGTRVIRNWGAHQAQCGHFPDGEGEHGAGGELPQGHMGSEWHSQGWTPSLQL